jgi:uncharacterized membrane protein YbaN (DUF454 family)
MKTLVWIGTYVPLLLAGATFVAMAISVLHRYSRSFREWWDAHVCAWMQKHALPQGKEND